MIYSSVQFSRLVVSDSLRPHELQHARPPCLSPTPGVYSNSCPSNHLILCRTLLLLPPIPPSIRVFSNESTLHMRWPKYWSFSFSNSPSNNHPGLISFRMDCWISLQSKGLWTFQHHSYIVSTLFKLLKIIWREILGNDVENIYFIFIILDSFLTLLVHS